MKKLTEEQIVQIVNTAISKKFGCSAEEINPITSFSNDLGADSLDMVELSFGVERGLSSALGSMVTLDSSIDNVATVQEFYNACAEHLRLRGFYLKD